MFFFLTFILSHTWRSWVFILFPTVWLVNKQSTRDQLEHFYDKIHGTLITLQEIRSTNHAQFFFTFSQSIESYLTYITLKWPNKYTITSTVNRNLGSCPQLGPSIPTLLSNNHTSEMEYFWNKGKFKLAIHQKIHPEIHNTFLENVSNFSFFYFWSKAFSRDMSG